MNDSGNVHGSESTRFVLEYENVIHVYNKHSWRLGTLKTAVTEIFSPLMDLGFPTLLKAVVPTSIDKSRRLSITCKILIFTSLNLSSLITQYIRSCQLITPLNNEFMEPAAKETIALKRFKAVDYIFRDLEKKLAADRKALEPPESIVRKRLLQHKKEGLWWLLNREESEELPPFSVENAGGVFEPLKKKSRLQNARTLEGRDLC
ncbi:hypothetical protein S83_071582 [Arachis hypogaea]|nr:putative SWI/SNF-related matrix-associated actin-dependent regulator of chromatin subfamily A member 3-like 1 [Arachis hypogaea]QHN83870.1 Putative SWI/SNF-related matrix-associated actin-dependent regulator of chromatin subfamily A member 3-like [Arachis hypogaea]